MQDDENIEEARDEAHKPQETNAGSSSSSPQSTPDAMSGENVSVGSVSGSGNIIFVANNMAFADLYQAVNAISKSVSLPKDSPLRDLVGQLSSAEGSAIPPGADLANDDVPAAERPDHLPDTEEEIARWYYERLNEAERRFVQAVAVFHGAPMHLVTKAAGELYIPSRERTRREEGSRRIRTDDVPRSTHELLTRTHTVRRTAGNAQRIFWADVERNGYSAFGLKVLRFIGDEAEGVVSLTGPNLLSTLKQWAVHGDGELRWRAAHALGVIWWRLDQNQVRKQARDWAIGKQVQEQQSAAGLLAGAYEAEHVEMGTGTAEVGVSVIARLLRQWSDEMLRADDTDDVAVHPRIVRTITATYGLIGRGKSLEVALDGLDYLIELTPGQVTREYVSLSPTIFVFASMSYIALAWSGMVRQVLARVAGHMDRLGHQRSQGLTTAQLARARLRREEGLAALFFVFFFVVVASLSGDDNEATSKYSRGYTPPPRPVIPGPEGRDVLLAAILSDVEDQVRADLITILCAAIIYGRGEVVFDIMRRWAEIVLRQRGSHAEELRDAYLRFVVSVGEQVMQWDRDMDRIGLHAKIGAFRHRIHIWANAGRAHGDAPAHASQPSDRTAARQALALFAEDVQAQLGA